MKTSCISINQLCDFISASERKKISILKSQKYPSPFITTRYKTARNCMKKFIKNSFSYAEIFEGIEKLRSKQCNTNHQKEDRDNSIAALEQFLNIKFPDYFKDKLFTFPKVEQSYIIVNDVKVIISPDIILSWVVDGSTYVGGIKFHISKSNIFDYEKASFSANMVRLYLEEVNNSFGQIDENFCLCVDVFGFRVCSSPKNGLSCNVKLDKACAEIHNMWETV